MPSNLRPYGQAPFTVAVIHGGPGAPGSMAPVARELSSGWGVLEPLQTADSLEGQLQELHDVLEAHGTRPVALIGSSWGAMLSYIFASRWPDFVRKLILVGSGVFDDQYAAAIMETRLRRLNAEDRRAFDDLAAALNDPATADKDAILARLGALLAAKTDMFDPLTLDTEVLEVRYDIHQNVWNDASKLRASGELVKLGRRIQCPVIALHGDYDPHPAEGIRGPLLAVLKDFRFVLLPHCGHYPWLERQARDEFFALLKCELD